MTEVAGWKWVLGLFERSARMAAVIALGSGALLALHGLSVVDLTSWKALLLALLVFSGSSLLISASCCGWNRLNEARASKAREIQERRRKVDTLGHLRSDEKRLLARMLFMQVPNTANFRTPLPHPEDFAATMLCNLGILHVQSNGVLVVDKFYWDFLNQHPESLLDAQEIAQFRRVRTVRS